MGNGVAQEAIAPARAPAEIIVPLTERVMARLPGPRWLWMLLWATWLLIILVVLRYLFPALLTVLFAEGETTLTFGFVTSYTMLVALWAVGKLGRDVVALGPTVVRLTQGRLAEGEPFRAVGSAWGPLVFMAIVTIPYGGVGFLKAPSLASALLVLAGFIGWLPLLTFGWVAGAVLLGLHRLGGTPLALPAFEVDRSLGLRPFGSLAFTPLAYGAVATPVLFLTGLRDLRDAIVSLGMLLVIVVLLFASLRRLRSQLLTAKASHLAWARSLFQHALDPIRTGDGVAGLRSGALELVAAEAIERRAAAIQEWPFDEGILRGIIAIVTSVTTAIVVRLVLSRLGL